MKFNKKLLTYILDLKKTDSVELENSIKGILTLLSGVSVNYINFDQDTFMPIDMDKLLKPESTIKDLMKFLKQKKYLVADFKPNLGFIVNRFEQAKYAEIYSTPNTYDYLDDFFLLKHVVNELLRLSKIRNPTSKCQMKFEFFFNVLLDSCLHSKCKILPPLNWYYFMTSLIKSKFGTELEPKMIKLTLMQINNLNSAYSLVKNFLVDTHSFYQFKYETQMIVLEHLVNIFDSQAIDSSLYLVLLTYIKRSKGGSNEVLREVVNFFLSLSKDHYFNPDLSEEKNILDIIVDVMEAIEDHELIRHVIKFEEALDNKFLMNFYLRTRLVVDQCQPFSLINESISLMVEQLTILERN
ncbi:hypothetical protein BpHYR1_011695 [Brachionus plicatilis]|uniref:Uncharacterized protein n=1 Tax=Brachionus plicatilis TaxID=10195 RepID=A0A3M7Q9V0_BRAPC|nr:hypothetical protein BpHYR1_011695 [Brachionus plicatilis]